MAFSDPQTMDAQGGLVAQTFVRLNTAKPETLGRFVSPDGKRELNLVQTSTRTRLRSVCTLYEKKVATDPLTATLSEVSASVSIVYDRPRNGFSVLEMEDIHNDLHNWLQVGSYSPRKKVLAGEN